MSDLDDEIYDLPEFESEKINIQEADPLLISPLIVSINSINSNPPSLEDYVGKSLQMKIIANNFHNLMSKPGIIQFNTESRKTIETAICAFVYEVASKSIETGKKEGRRENLDDLSASQELFELTNSQLVETATNIESLKKQIQQAKDANDKLTSQVKEQADELESLYATNSQLNKTVLELQKESDKEILALKEKNDHLTGTITSLQYSIKLLKSAQSRFDKQRDESNAEIANYKSEISELKSKLKSRNENDETSEANQRQIELSLRQYETENQQLKVSANELNRKLDFLNKELQQYTTDIPNPQEQENQNLIESLSLITKEYELQTKDLFQLRNINGQQQQIINQFQAILNFTDKHIQSFETEKDKLKEQCSQLIEASKLTNKELENIMKYKEYFDEIKSLFNSDIADSEIVTEIQSLLAPKPSMDDIKIQILFRTLENHIRFMSNLVSSNKIDLNLFTNRNSESISDDSQLQSQIAIELSRASRFLKENGIESSENDQINSIDISQLTNDRELIDCYGSLVMQLRMIQNLYSKSKPDKDSNEKAIIQKIIKGIQYDGSINDLADTIIDDIFSLTEKVETIKSIVNEDDDEMFVKTVRIIADVYHQFDTKIREVIKFTGQSTELPNATLKFIQSLSKKPNKEEQSTLLLEKNIKDLEEQKEEFKKTIEMQSQALLAKSNELENSQKTYSDLKSQYEEITNRQNDSLVKIRESANTYSVLKASYDKLREANKQMEVAHEQRIEQLVEKFHNALDEEREQHHKEIEVMNQNRIASEDRLIEQRQKLKEKYKAVKAKLKEVITTYDAAFKKQKLANAQLKANYDKLLEELVNANSLNNEEMTKISNEKSYLTVRIKTLQIENQNLNSKINALHEKCRQIENARDNFWTSEISKKEIEYRKRESSLAQSQNSFIQEIISKLSSYGPKPIEISQKYVLILINSILDTINDHQLLISKLQDEIKRSI